MSKKQPKRVSFGWLFITFAAVFALYLIASNNIASQKQLLIAQESSHRIALSRLETERAALEKEIALADTDAYIENLARTQYGFLKPGEIRFEITNPEALFQGGESAALEITQSREGS